MSHVRTQIRNAVATAVTGLASTGSNVFKGRYHSLQNGKIPALCVYTTGESAEVDVMGTSARGSMRELDLAIEVYAKVTAVVEDTLDAIAVSVEEAIASDTTLSGVCKDIMYTGFDLDADSDAEQTVAVLRMNFTVRYRVAENDVETAI